ncbi:uncharacterized protein TNCV_3640481 [Trichonephila clavipes]|nr:uncharacterized protein TNCV_3640481 [Trichonephila clavipes]
MLTAVTVGLVSNPREEMNVCKCIVPLRQGGSLNSRQSASPLARLVKEEEWWETPERHQGVVSEKWDRKSQNVLSPAWCSRVRLTTGKESSTLDG